MTNQIAIAITAFVMLLNLAVIIRLIIVDMRFNRDKLIVYLLNASIALLGWQIVYIIFFATTDMGIMRFTYDFKLPFIAFTSFFIALTVLRFYRLDRYINKISVLIMLIIPFLTFIYSLISPYNNIIRQTFSILAIHPIHEVITERGIWFWIHTSCCYAFLVGALLIGIFSHRKLPGIYRVPSFVLLTGLTLVIVINVLNIVGVNYRNYDISIVGASLAVTTIYFSAIKSKGVDFISSARDIIYDYLSEGIFVLNDERYIVYLNKNAKKLVQSLGLNALNQLYDNVFEKTVEYASNITAAPADEDGLDMTFKEKRGITIYNLREKPIKDLVGMPIGTLAVLSDVTENRTIINKLEDIGGIDALTGLPNRRSIDKFMASVDHRSKLPISIISADVNNLKKVNDDLGHKQGDVLIRLVADILSDVCPARGRVSRIGGDEFLFVVPNSEGEDIRDMITEMKSRLANSKNYIFKPSVSFGFDTKIEEGQKLENVIQSADEKMFENKVQMKAQRKE